MGHGVKKDGERRKWNPNFTSPEIVIEIFAEVEAWKTYLFGELKGPIFTQATRDRAWTAVAEKVNAVSPVLRSVQDLKNKFADLKTRTKQKANQLCREARKTGGGQNPAAKLTNSEELLCSFIGKESIEGKKKYIVSMNFIFYIFLGIKKGFDIGVPSTSSYASESIESTPSCSTHNEDLGDRNHQFEPQTTLFELIAPPSPFTTPLTTDTEERKRDL